MNNSSQRNYTYCNLTVNARSSALALLQTLIKITEPLAQ
jgi:hypothetical protein